MFQETIPRFCHRNQGFFLKKDQPCGREEVKEKHLPEIIKNQTNTTLMKAYRGTYMFTGINVEDS